nr:uncharacterized protein LOC112289041 isoform X3 [Physcomitrium patens]|eukprot:XP_024389733.1 uncharacterized protein LOC112289041 isoform X3 [Physcomitrella patens]
MIIAAHRQLWGTEGKYGMDFIPAGSGFEDAGQGNKRGASRARSLKRVKLAGTGTATDEKTYLITPVKGGGNRIATAAKVAAKVAPNVVTGGVVAEAGPRPDFSLWTVEDDLLLENAMEAGAAVEALAKGAMRFSHRFTVRELRERWRALLYDPELSAEASARMVEAEAALSDLPPKVGAPHDRHAKHLEQNRKANSIRFLYYKRKRPLVEGKLVSATESQTPDEGTFREVREKHEDGREKSVVAPLSTMTLGNVDPGLLEGLLSPKGGSTDFDCTFTQMVSLLAAGGVGAVIGALPGNQSLENLEDPKRRQEVKCQEPIVGSITTAPKREDVTADQLQSQIPIVPGGNNELNSWAHVSVKEVVLKIPPVQSDIEKQVKEGEGTEAKEGKGIESKEGESIQVKEVVGIQEKEGLGVQEKEDVGIQAKEGVGIQEKEGVGIQEKEGVGIQAKEGVGIQAKEGVGIQAKEGVGIQAKEGAGIQAKKIVGIQVKEGECQSASANDGCKEAVHPVENLEWNAMDTDSLLGCQTPIQATTASTVTKEISDSSPNVLMSCNLSDTVHAEVGGNLTKPKTEDLFCTMNLGIDASVVPTKQLVDASSVKVEQAAETVEVGCIPGVEISQPHLAIQESHQEASNPRDETAHDFSGSHLRWKHGDSINDIEQDQVQYLESYQNQEQDSESDQDFDSEQHFPYIEGEYDGEYHDNEGLEVHAGDELLYASDSGEAILHHDLSMSTDYAQARPINDTMIDPIFGPIVCTLSTEDTEIPNLDDVLPPPQTSFIYNSDGELRDGYLLDCTSLDDEAEVPSSPSEFHVYEAWESSDTLKNRVHASRYEDDNVWDLEMGAGKQERTFSQSCGQNVMAGNLNPNAYFTRPMKDECPSLSDVDGENQLIQFPALQLHDADIQRASSDTAGTLSSTGQHAEGQPIRAEGNGEFYHGDIDPFTGQEVLARVDPETGVLKSDEEASALEIAEEELESEAYTRFSDVETMIMNMDLDPGVDDEFSALEESRRMYRRQRRMLVRLEQNFSSAMQRSLTKRKALAILYGRHLLYYMTKPEVLMGRMTQDNIVDIDLGKEGRANKVSRQQASLKLKEDGFFYLRNLGRRTLTVNNIPVDSDQRAMLGSNCLIEVGGMCFIFEINKRLVKQHVARMHRSS